ncbi:MAG: PBSX family phage terminase large subunit [Oscillospiraceae bacterium]|nr:PBSX family phage terminase large subunit [Oscillospiraceae bacterium]
MADINIPIKDIIIPMYDDVLEDILNHGHTDYIFPGGRGSTKSSFVGGVAIPLLIIQNPECHAMIFRQVANTIQNSTRSQVEWGIYKMGLEDLFTIPKRYNNPIVFKPTGQQIIFAGMDEPGKFKSLKLPFGYVGITWWEELDQYAGENTIRNVLQSTQRGGDKFWNFMTFNPPISKNNWANEYTETAETNERLRETTLVVRNTYLDVPEEWLGGEFIARAEMLKEINPRAYEHEYMGKAIGTGGDVFQNASDLDMTELIPQFDRIYCGIDWGYAQDPFRFVRMHFDSKHLDLYIFAEYSTTKTRNEQVFDILYKDKKLITTDELVTADSAEEKSIADFRAYDAFIRGAEKGPDSVRYGIKWLQGLRNIYIDKRRCPLTYKEFVNYEYETDRDGNFISAYPDADNHSIDAVRYALEKYWKRRGN